MSAPLQHLTVQLAITAGLWITGFAVWSWRRRAARRATLAARPQAPAPKVPCPRLPHEHHAYTAATADGRTLEVHSAAPLTGVDLDVLHTVLTAWVGVHAADEYTGLITEAVIADEAQTLDEELAHLQDGA